MRMIHDRAGWVRDFGRRSRPWHRERGAYAKGVGGIAPVGAYRSEVSNP